MQLLFSTITTISHVAATILGFIGIGVMVYGSLKAVVHYARHISANETLIPQVRIELAQHIALGLEFLVGKDLIESIVNPGWNEIGLLAALIAIRTFVTLFLSWEVKELEKEVKWWGRKK